jgi:hypothetical protein
MKMIVFILAGSLGSRGMMLRIAFELRRFFVATTYTPFLQRQTRTRRTTTTSQFSTPAPRHTHIAWHHSVFLAYARLVFPIEAYFHLQKFNHRDASWTTPREGTLYDSMLMAVAHISAYFSVVVSFFGAKYIMNLLYFTCTS